MRIIFLTHGSRFPFARPGPAGSGRVPSLFAKSMALIVGLGTSVNSVRISYLWPCGCSLNFVPSANRNQVSSCRWLQLQSRQAGSRWRGRSAPSWCFTCSQAAFAPRHCGFGRLLNRILLRGHSESNLTLRGAGRAAFHLLFLSGCS